MGAFTDAWHWAEEHPWTTTAGVVIVGLGVLWLLGGGGGGGRGGGGQAASTDAAAYYAAQGASNQSADQLQAVTTAANAQTAQAGMAAQASIAVNQAWSQAQTTQTQFNDQATTAQAKIAAGAAIKQLAINSAATTQQDQIAANAAVTEAGIVGQTTQAQYDAQTKQVGLVTSAATQQAQITANQAVTEAGYSRDVAINSSNNNVAIVNSNNAAANYAHNQATLLGEYNTLTNDQTAINEATIAAQTQRQQNVLTAANNQLQISTNGQVAKYGIDATELGSVAGALSGYASLPNITSTSKSNGFLGLFGGSKTTTVANPAAVTAAGDLSGLLASLEASFAHGFGT